MSLLSLVQDACEDLGINSPASVVGNTSDQIIQMLSIANREGRDLAKRYAWSQLMKNTTWTLALAEDQGLLNSAVVTAGDFDSILPETMFNRTKTQPIVENTNQTEWETRQAYGLQGVWTRYKIQGGKLYLYPAPAAADTGAFAYKSTHWCESSGGTGQKVWTADTDVGRLDEDLMSLGIVWRWLKRKGLDYAEDFNTYEKRVLEKMGRDGQKARLNLGNNNRQIGPGVTMNPWSPI